MCRFIAYKGAPILMDKLLYQPKNSLINQSFNAKELDEPLNGDGFGVGWYVPELGIDPAVFVSVNPAWNNRNLRYLSPKIESPCIIAHVRAASVGDVSESNCHPFHYKNMLMMHNGGIEEFAKIKRSIRDRLSDEMYNWIKGQTDSEHIYALFLDKYIKLGAMGPEAMVTAMESTIAEIEIMKVEHDMQDASYLNLCITDGKSVVAFRYVSENADDPLTLYYSAGSKYVCEDGVCHMVDASDQDHSAMIVSEKLTDLKDDWKLIPKNYTIMIHEDLSVHLQHVKVSEKMAMG